MQVVWNPTDHDFWDAAHARAGAALLQDWAYGVGVDRFG